VKIGIVGGTGDIGEGIAMRLASRYDVIVGSRDEARAKDSCTCSINTLKGRGTSCRDFTGATNQDAVCNADVVILAIPFRNVIATLDGLSGFEDKIVISPVNPMEKKDHFTFVPPEEGSAALMIRRLLPKEARICSAFNTIAANKWKALDEELTYSVPVCSDDDEAKKQVMAIVNSVSKLQAFDAGPLAASSMVEALTPLLLNIARYNKMRDVGIQFR
jgi:8-hydroxy-5-deazaflavin:NADPH oxidoreductase